MGDRGCLSIFGDRADQHRMFAEQVTAKYIVRTEGRGRTVDEWKARPEQPDNHWLDCLVGCAVTASMQGALLFGTDVGPLPRTERLRFRQLQKTKRAHPWNMGDYEAIFCCQTLRVPDTTSTSLMCSFLNSKRSGQVMRLFGSFGIFVSLCFSIQAQVSPSVTEVRQKLRSIELESYLSAYKDATVNLRELEVKLVMSNSSESRAFLEQNRENLSKHLDTLAARTIEIAQQIELMKAATTAKEKLPDGTRVYLHNRLQQTGRDLDIAIEGRGFLQAVDATTGENVYARVCNLDIDANGHMVLGSSRSGLLLSPSISIPQDAIAIVFTEKGEVNCRVAGETNLRTMGQIQLAQFSNPEGLFEIAENLFAETEASGPATLAKPGQEGAGVIRQGNIEVSDSNRVRELVGLLVNLLTAEYYTDSLRPR